MSQTTAGVSIPDSPAALEATEYVRARLTPLLFDHSLRVFLFGSLHVRALALDADQELLYVAALFHDAGLLTPSSNTPQRFEVEGADLARSFLLERGYSDSAARLVWSAIALHSTPGIPRRMEPEVAATNLGVLTDAVGLSLNELDSQAVGDIVAAYPRGDFKREFLGTFYEGLRHRPGTTYGTVNADILEHFDPDFRRDSMVDRVLSSPWES